MPAAMELPTPGSAPEAIMEAAAPAAWDLTMCISSS